MKRLLAVLFVMMVSPLHLSGGTFFRARVVGISDGDTLTVLDSKNKQHKIRLYGIDAPEKKQAYGSKSKNMLSERLFMYSHEVNVEVINRDRYGRIVGIVYACACCPTGDATIYDCNVNSRSVNEDMLDYGYAWAYRSYLKSKDRDNYIMLESIAKQRGTGLWADPYPVEPWKFRKKKRI